MSEALVLPQNEAYPSAYRIVFLKEGQKFRAVYTKLDGSFRACKGRVECIKKSDAFDDTLITYFDLGMMNFRAFYWSKVINFEPEYED